MPKSLITRHIIEQIVRPSLDESAKKKTIEEVRSIFQNAGTIDFNSKEIRSQLVSLAEAFKTIFTAAGNTEIDFTKMINTSSTEELFTKLGTIAGEKFQSAWNSVVKNFGNNNLNLSPIDLMKQLEDEKNALLRRQSKYEERLGKYEYLAGLQDSIEDDSIKAFSLKELSEKGTNVDEFALGLQEAFTKAEDQLISVKKGTKEYHQLLIDIRQTISDMYRMAGTIQKHPEIINDQSILNDYDYGNLYDLTDDVLSNTQKDFNGIVSRYMEQYKSVKINISTAVDQIIAKEKELMQNNPELIDQQNATAGLKTLNEIEGAYTRILNKARKGRQSINAVAEKNILSALNYNQGDKSLLQLSRGYTNSVDSGENWEIQYQWLVKFVKEYEAYAAREDANTNQLSKHKALYEQLKPMAVNAENMLRNVLNMAKDIPLVGMEGIKISSGEGTGDSTGDGTGDTQEGIENANKLAEVLQRVEAAYKELDALSDDPWNIKNEEEVNRILQERLAIIQRVGAENLKAHNPEAYEGVEYINDEYVRTLNSIAEAKDDAIYDNLDENFGYNNEIIESSQNLEVLLAKRRELMQGIHFDGEQEYLEQEQINQAIERRIALMKQLEPLVANGSITQDRLEDMVFEQGDLDERRAMLEGIQQNLFNADPESLDDAQFLLDQYEKIMVETASGKKLTLGPEMSEADWKAFMNMSTEKAKSIEFVRKEIEATVQAQAKLNGVEGQNPTAQDDSIVHNANTDAINAENAALQQQKKIINDVVTAKEGLKASQTKLGITDGKDIFGESTLDVVKEKQNTLKTYLQELTQIEAQEKKNGALTEAEVARRKELVEIVRNMGLAVRYKDGSFYDTGDFGAYDKDLSKQIEQLTQIINLKKQISLGYYDTGSYGALADTFSGESIASLLQLGSSSFDDMLQFDSSMIGQLVREYQYLHEEMLKCMLVGEEVPQDTLDRMKWFESVDATQLDSLLPKLTELQQKIQSIQNQEGLSSYQYEQDNAYYDNKIQNLSTLLALQKEYLKLGGPTNGFDNSLRYTSEDLQQLIDRFMVLKQGASDVTRLKEQFSNVNLRSTPDMSNVVDKLHLGEIGYDEALSTISQLINAQKQLNDEKLKEPHSVDDTPQVKNENVVIDEQNSKLRENINLKTQSNGQDGLVYGSDKLASGSINGESDSLEAIRAKIAEITKVVNLKTQAFTNEEAEVQRVVTSEVASLNSLEQKVITIKSSIEGLLNNIRTGQGDIGAGLNNITVTVNNSDTTQDSEQKGAWALETTLQTVKGALDGVRSDINNVINAIGNIGTKSVSTEIGNVLATESTLSAIKSILNLINGKIISGVVGSKSGSNTTSTNKSNQSIVDYNQITNNDPTYSNNQRITEQIKTALSSLLKYKTALQEARQLSGDLEVGIGALYNELSKVSDKAGLSVWNEHFKQFKNASSILQTLVKDYEALGVAEAKANMELDTTKRAQYLDDIQIIQDRINTKMVDVNVGDDRFEESRQRAYNLQTLELQRQRELENSKQNQIHNTQVEAEIVKQLVQLYEQLGRAQAAGNSAEVARIRGLISADRLNLTSVDYSTDMKFKAAKNKGYNAEQTKIENAALKEQSIIIEKLTKMYQEYGMLKERAGAVSGGNLSTQLTAEADDKLAEINATRKLLSSISPELEQKFSESFNIGQSLESAKQLEAMAKSMDIEEKSRVEELGKEYQKLGRLKAQAETTKGTNERQYLEEQIKLQEEIIRGKQKGLNINQSLYDTTMLDAYNRKLDEINQKTARQKDQDIIKDQKTEFRNLVKQSQQEAGISQTNSVLNNGRSILANAMSVDGITDVQIEKLRAYQVQIQNLNDLYYQIRNSDGVVSEQQKQELISQTNNVNMLNKEINGLLAEYNKLNVDNAQVIGTDKLGAGASLEEYKKQLTDAVMATTNGKASITGFDNATKTLSYTIRTGRYEVTGYTASARQLDGQLVALKNDTKKLETPFGSLKRKIRELSFYFTGIHMFYRVFSTIKQGITYIKEIDSALTELKKVTDETEATYDKFLNTAAKTADKVGSTIKDVVSSTADWARLGYSMQEAAQLAESTQILMNVSEFTDISNATDSLISSIQAFKYTAEESMDVVDILNTIGNNYAISTADLATSLTKSSGSLVAANGTLEEAVALTATAM